MKPFAVVSVLCLIAGSLIFSACGPIKSTSLIVKADLAVHGAKTAQAEKKSPFEYFSAEEYLHKAREKWSRSDFEYAMDYAKKARGLAIRARDRSLSKDQE